MLLNDVVSTALCCHELHAGMVTIGALGICRQSQTAIYISEVYAQLLGNSTLPVNFKILVTRH